MEQGSSASELAARTASMTDEQILDLDLETLQNGGGVGAQGTPAGSIGASGDFGDEWEAVETSFSSQGAVMSTAPARLDNTNTPAPDPPDVRSCLKRLARIRRASLRG
jgi:hypothetical protein